MNRSFLTGAASAIALFGVTAVSSAQLSTQPVGVTLRAGAFFPVNSQAENLGNTWFGFGAQYSALKLGKTDLLLSGHSTIDLSIDYFGRNNVSNTPLLANYVLRTHSIFYSAGAGVGFVQGVGSRSAQFTYQAGVGYEFGHGDSIPFFLEARWWGCAQSQLNGIGVYAGVRL